jgi:hypothetical protein
MKTSLAWETGPDTTIVGRYRQRDLLERRDFFEIEIAAVQFFDVVAPDGKPKRDPLFFFSRVYCDEGVLRSVVSGKQE